ncbi:MAG: amidophosphoribosyltransferase [Alphaproteobacteria bacterium]|nr:amidophosphoribosyltransferase [Alphaproteobacteria bacterium]
MCGIAGLFIKSAAREGELGRLLSAMVIELSDRGPDSAGFAFYGAPAPQGAVKCTFFHDDPSFDWDGFLRALDEACGIAGNVTRRGSHRIAAVRTDARELRGWIDRHHPTVHVMGFGERVEIFKEKGLPADVIRSFDLATMRGSHALGHTRMATESAVTTEHSHPFSTGVDLCLVHNGSLSNHNRLRAELRRRGMRFDTDNDTEVAAAYLTYRMQSGASLKETLETGLKDLDGFYTFAVGTRDGFAIVRDAIACKPAVLAETAEWVAMATEYRAIATLPGAEDAMIWEPRPATVYAWQRQ